MFQTPVLLTCFLYVCISLQDLIHTYHVIQELGAFSLTDHDQPDACQWLDSVDIHMYAKFDHSGYSAHLLVLQFCNFCSKWVSSSSGCVGKVTSFYCGTPSAFNVYYFYPPRPWYSHIILGFLQEDKHIFSGCIFKTCLIASQVFYTFVNSIDI